MPADTTAPQPPRTRREARLRAQAARSTAAASSPVTPPTAAGTGVDRFDAAVRMLATTGRTPVIRTEAPAPMAAPAATNRRDRRAARAPRFSLRRLATVSATVGGVAAVGLLAVGMTLPAGAGVPSAAAAVTPATLAATGGGDAGMQAYVAPHDTKPAGAASLNRSAGFTAAVTPPAPTAASSGPTTVSVPPGDDGSVQMAGTIGILNFSNSVFTNDRACPVQWPFAVGVPISWGFGPRPGEFHEGVDFTPGAGAHIQAIADGVVAVASESYYGYGVTVVIDHVIDGQKVASLYAHMEYGSMQVHVGETVQVGQYLGNTGATGYAFGANTHFEIRENDTTPINPIPWLQAHNQC